MSETKLKELWNFDEADLGANRLGKLTEKQKVFLSGEHKSQRNVFIGVGVGVAFIFCCLPLVFGARGLLPLLLSGDLADLSEIVPTGALGGIGLGVIAAVAVPIALAVGIYMVRANKKADTTVKQVSGEVQYTWGTKRVRNPTGTVKYKDVPVLHLYLGDKKFEVKEELQAHIKQGDEWTVYYTSYPFKFLSAEKNKK